MIDSLQNQCSIEGSNRWKPGDGTGYCELQKNGTYAWKAALHLGLLPLLIASYAYDRHGSHVEALRHAAICALDLGHNPSAVDDNVLFLEVKLKFEHANLPPHRKYKPSAGFVMTMGETAEMLGMFAWPVIQVRMSIPFSKNEAVALAS